MSDKDNLSLLVREVFDKDSVEFIKQLESKQPNGKYKITFDLTKLESSSSPLGLTDKIYDKPSEYVDLFREISLDFVNKYLAFEKVDLIDFYFKANKNRVINPSNLHVSYGNKLVRVHGLIVACGILEPLCISSIFTCLTCANEMEVKHGLQRNNIKKCDNPSCGSTSIIEESAVFTDLKAITIQDALHKDSDSSENVIPTPIGVMLKDGLAFTKIKNGDIINVSGVLKPFQISPKSSHYKYLLIGTDIEIEGQASLVILTKEDIMHILEVSIKDNVLDLLADSLAPSIYNSGNILDIKRGLILQAIGGVDLILPDGKRNRGNIHIFLCGDPSTSKSTLLRQMQNVIPNTIYTQGKGNTSVGLIATVLKDEVSGRWMVQAGAAILADGGLLILDEMDNANKEDLNALNESAESSIISINKAGIHQKFKTVYSLLAAANPKMGRFDPMKSIIEQLTTIPPPLLSRFDLRFMIYDIPNIEQDTMLAEHIIKGYVASESLKPIYDKDFLMKYILYARMNCKPRVTREAMDIIKKTYVSIRNIKSDDGRVPLTPRQLEGMIRLSVATAKVRLSNIVEEKDVKKAFEIFKSTVDGGSEADWDADQIEGRISTKKRNKMQFIIDYVKEKKQIRLDELIDYCKKNDIENCDELVDYMRRQGILYEIMSGVIGVV